MYGSLQDWQEHVDSLEYRNAELKQLIYDMIRVYEIPKKYDVSSPSGILTVEDEEEAYRLEYAYFAKEFAGSTGSAPCPSPYVEVLGRKVYI